MRISQIVSLMLLVSMPCFSIPYEKIEEIDVLKPLNSNIHGYVDLGFKNDYVTPRGLLVTKTGVTTQVLTGLILDIYKEPSSLISKVSLVGYIWNDLWSKQHNHNVGCWNEMDWGLGASLQIANDWQFTSQYVEFLSPPGNFTPEKNIETTLAYDDSKWKLPVVINPYVRWFWTVSGDSTVTVGKRGRTFDVELGLVPTFDFRKYDFPLILLAPTWLTVGPAEFWNGGKLGLKNKRSNFGVFSTGLRAEIPIEYIPTSLGSWYIYGGVQYYHFINDSLLQAQTVTLGISSWTKAHRHAYVAVAGFGFRF